MPDYPAALNLVGSPLAPNCDPAIQASAASLANVITCAITKVSGTNAITGFRLPRGFRGVFVVIPTGAFTGATGGTLAYSSDGTTEDIPIGLAFTAVVGRALFFVSNGLLVYPSYV
jgi:hypothetical protein